MYGHREKRDRRDEMEKGRVGKFSVWLVGSQQWEIKNRRTGEVVATAQNMNGAFKIAEQFNGGIK
jgi:hypothetical protein